MGPQATVAHPSRLAILGEPSLSTRAVPLLNRVRCDAGSRSRHPRPSEPSGPRIVALVTGEMGGRSRSIPKVGWDTVQFAWCVPTVKDRVVQGAIKLLLEPIFEAQFWNVSYGFRPGRSVHGALERIRLAIQPRKRDKDGHRRRLPYRWIGLTRCAGFVRAIRNVFATYAQQGGIVSRTAILGWLRLRQDGLTP
jgi:hypothetical protein